MTDDKLLAKLYELKKASNKDAFIDAWIADTKCDIAADSFHTVGIGDGKKMWKTWIQRNRKKDALMSGLIRTSSLLPTYILMTDKFIIKTHDDQTLPTTTAYRAEANKASAEIAAAKKSCTAKVLLHRRDDYDAELKILKAQKQTPVTQIWDGGPMFDLKTLLELTTVFSDSAFYDPRLKASSPLRLVRGNTECLFFPEK